MHSCFASQLKKSKLSAYDDVEGQLWRDSVLASIAAEQCSKVFRVHAPQEATTSALLLNVGKVVLSRFISKEIQEYISVCKLNGKNQIQAEMEILNIHFGEVGGLIAQHWGLPYEITIGISFQHNPDEVKNTTSDVAHICYKLVEYFSKPPSFGQKELQINPNVLERLQPSSKSWFDVMRELVKERYLKVCRSYDLPDNDLLPPNWDSVDREQEAILQSAHA
jgi:HD-like signal output (HDOD) protein